MQYALETGSAQTYNKGQEQQNTAALKQLEFIGKHCLFSFWESNLGTVMRPMRLLCVIGGF